MKETDIKKAASLIQNSKHTVFFTGAGLSVESGIPPFRDEKGLWTIHNAAHYVIDRYGLREPGKADKNDSKREVG
ncbi:Sir2 family NAD-dependent protein deacetylase [Thermodesulfobacteriota bacterium]